MRELPAGRYDELVTTGLVADLDEIAAEVEAVDGAEQPYRFAQHVGKVVAQVLPDVDEGQRVEIVNALVARLGASDTNALAAPPRRLVGVKASDTLGRLTLPPAPDIPLGAHDLLVNARGEPHLAAELKKEIASADRIDLIVAFVRWYGVRLLFEELEAAIRRGTHVRLLTTTYTGSTERLALDRLSDLGVDVRISYDTAVTRLHAKAWIFHRDSGYSTAYVGSSNLTRSALMDGREWNVRLSRAASPALFDKIASAFEAHWESSDFEAYDPSADAERLTVALRRGAGETVSDAESLSGLSWTPWPYQVEILEALDAERTIRSCWRNLVVAPTGTGKTVVAALDYARLRRQRNTDLSLLFVAHRERILTQSRRVFREIVGDGSFGELFVGGVRPARGRHVFASIQTLHQNDPMSIPPDAFDVVIVDEFHHAEAATYRRLLDHLQPKVMLALTATPERADGLDIRAWTDGRTAFDMRLWHALDRQLLAPFQYFGLADIADLDTVRFSGGRYSAEDLTNVYTADDTRARLILRQVHKIVAAPESMKALGFCATVDHARAMADHFNRAGLPATVLSGESPEAEREAAIRALRHGELTTIFTRDVFNEGIDIPEVDTILLLRPTESVTVFLQQIGRGLRRHPGKEVCTVLDFVANYRQEFRFDLRLRALTGIARRDLLDAARGDFPYLPSGCHIELERQAKEWVLDHLKQAVRTNMRALRTELTLLGTRRSEGGSPTLSEFLAETGVELEDIGRVGGWARLQREAGVALPPAGPNEAELQRGVERVYHLDDVDRLDQLATWLSASTPPRTIDVRDRRLAWMFLVALWGLRGAPDSFEAAWDGLWRSPAILDELRQTVPILRDRLARVPVRLPDHDVPLQIGATYARDEILAAFGRLAPGERYSHQAGPWWHEPAQTEVLFITLQKTEKDYSPQTMYRDHAISPDLFHWESQNKTRVESQAGRRYLEQRTNGVRILLAVRAARQTPWGRTAPYVLLGPADYVSHEGERPIAITWRLQTPIPADLFEDFKVAAA